LDMAAYWQPTVTGYFGRVSKERIIKAVQDGVSKQVAENIVRLKKPAMAEAAETALAERAGFRRCLLRVPHKFAAQASQTERAAQAALFLPSRNSRPDSGGPSQGRIDGIERGCTRDGV
jgi:ParB family chromosome partitioning protein